MHWLPGAGPYIQGWQELVVKKPTATEVPHHGFSHQRLWSPPFQREHYDRLYWSSSCTSLRWSMVTCTSRKRKNQQKIPVLCGKESGNTKHCQIMDAITSHTSSKQKDMNTDKTTESKLNQPPKRSGWNPELYHQRGSCSSHWSVIEVIECNSIG